MYVSPDPSRAESLNEVEQDAGAMEFPLKTQRQPDGGGDAGAEAVALERDDQVGEPLKPDSIHLL